jgi:hypothetical protein
VWIKNFLSTCWEPFGCAMTVKLIITPMIINPNNDFFIIPEDIL